MGSDDWPDWLPGDWSILIRKVDGKKVKCYIGPDGHKCYSKPQLFEYLKRTNKSIPDDKTENVVDPGIDLSAEPTATLADEVPEISPVGHPTKLTPRTNRRKSITGDLSEEHLGGDDSSSEPVSNARHRGDSSWLPAGWTVEDKFRKGGNSTGTKYKVYKDPISGQKFFSKPQVLNYLAKINNSAGVHEAVFVEPISALPISSWQEKPATEPDSSQYEATEVENKTEEKTKSSRLSSDYEVTSRTPADGLPPGWIKEVRTRKSGSSTRKDTYYLDPLGQYAFCSKKDALRYLESGDIKQCVSRPVKRQMNNEDTLNVNLTSTGEETPPQPDQSKGTEASMEFTNGSAEELKTDKSGVENPTPLRSITGGSISTPERRSFVPPKEDTDWLPDGWLVDVRYKSSGMKYKIYKDPATGKLFYSKPQVLSYLSNGSISSSRKRKFVSTNNVQKPTSGDGVAKEVPKDVDTTDPKPSDNTNHRAKRQKGKNPETEGNGTGQEKQERDGNMSFDIPEDDNWPDQCLNFEVKTLADEIILNGRSGFQEENAGVETTGVKDTTPTKVN